MKPKARKHCVSPKKRSPRAGRPPLDCPETTWRPPEPGAATCRACSRLRLRWSTPCSTPSPRRKRTGWSTSICRRWTAGSRTCQCPSFRKVRGWLRGGDPSGTSPSSGTAPSPEAVGEAGWCWALCPAGAAVRGFCPCQVSRSGGRRGFLGAGAYLALSPEP